MNLISRGSGESLGQKLKKLFMLGQKGGGCERSNQVPEKVRKKWGETKKRGAVCPSGRGSLESIPPVSTARDYGIFEEEGRIGRGRGRCR